MSARARVADRVRQMRFSKPDAAIQKQRVVRAARIFCHLHRCGTRQLIRLAGDEGIERQVRIKPRALELIVGAPARREPAAASPAIVTSSRAPPLIGNPYRRPCCPLPRPRTRSKSAAASRVKPRRAICSVNCERIASSFRRLGAQIVKVAVDSSKSSALRGLIQAENCCGVSSLSRSREQSFHRCIICFAAPRLSFYCTAKVLMLGATVVHASAYRLPSPDRRSIEVGTSPVWPTRPRHCRYRSVTFNHFRRSTNSTHPASRYPQLIAIAFNQI